MSKNLTTVLKAKTKTVEMRRNLPVVIVEERINPTGRKIVMAAFQAGNFNIVRKDPLDQVAVDDAVLDVNAGIPGADEQMLLREIIRTVSSTVGGPSIPATSTCYQW